MDARTKALIAAICDRMEFAVMEAKRVGVNTRVRDVRAYLEAIDELRWRQRRV